MTTSPRPRPAKPIQFDPLVPQPAYGRVATAIEQKILERSLRPGDLLPTETDLARQFGVNRSTVREALRRLESNGLVGRDSGAKRLRVTRPGHADTASRVSRALTLDEVTFIELWEAMLAVAPRTAALAAAHVGAESLEALEADFATKAREASGLVRVAASTVVAQYLLLPSLAGLNARHPRLRVELEVSDRLVDMARDGIDIAIRTASTLPDTMVARQIGTLGRALYAAPGYAAASGLPQHPGELHRHRLIANSAATQLNHWPFVVHGQPVKLAIEGFWRTNDTGLAANMVLQGLGIGRLSTLVAEPLVLQQRLVQVLGAFVDRQTVPIYAVTASSRQRLPKIRACIDYWAGWIGAGQAEGVTTPTPAAAPPRARRAAATR
jgi:DNA-binding transcriptional LysR family regulator/DNA-binding transcriptional regulator YhcF (GntR family)